MRERECHENPLPITQSQWTAIAVLFCFADILQMDAQQLYQNNFFNLHFTVVITTEFDPVSFVPT